MPSSPHIHMSTPGAYFRTHQELIRWKGWEDIIPREPSAVPNESFITVVDINGNGVISHQQICISGNEEDLLKNQQALLNAESETSIRAVLVNDLMTTEVLDVVGVALQLEPQFVVAHMRAWPHQSVYEGLCSSSASGLMYPNFLSFGSGCFGKMFSVDQAVLQHGGCILLLILPSSKDAIRYVRDMPKLQEALKPSTPPYRWFGPDPIRQIDQDSCEIDFMALFVDHLYRASPDLTKQFVTEPLLLFAVLFQITLSVYYAGAQQFALLLNHNMDIENWEKIWGGDSLLTIQYFYELVQMDWQHFEAYDTYHGTRAVDHAVMRRIREQSDHVVCEFQRLERFCRKIQQDCIDAQMLKQSHESIKQSRISITEAKGTKLLTVLAFVFLPVNLVTSVFGMNIRQLNGNGQPLWVFLATVGAVLGASTIVWAVSYQLHLYKRLSNKDIANHDNPSNWGISEQHAPWRLKLKLAWLLVYHGRWIWIWKSGIIFSLWSGGEVSFLRSCTTDNPACSLTDDKNRTTRLQVKKLLGLEFLPGEFFIHESTLPCAYIIGHLGQDQNHGFSTTFLETVN